MRIFCWHLRGLLAKMGCPTYLCFQADQQGCLLLQSRHALLRLDDRRRRVRQLGGQELNPLLP